MSIEAMKLALEALEVWQLIHPDTSASAVRNPAIKALRTAIEQAEKPWVKTYAGGKPNYTTPPQREWVGLTDEEIMDACSAVWASHPIEVGRVVEAKLKEKNGG